jgi:hypothetical protein
MGAFLDLFARLDSEILDGSGKWCAFRLADSWDIFCTWRPSTVVIVCP